VPFKSLKKIEGTEEHLSAVTDIAMSLSEVGQLDRAVEVSGKIQEPIERFQAFAAIMAAKREAEKRKIKEGQEAK